MNISFTPLKREHAEEIVSWRYDDPYEIYDYRCQLPQDAIDYLTDPINQFFAALCDDKAQNLAQGDRMSELDLVQPDGDKAIVGELDAGRDVGVFVDPFQQIATKQGALFVHVFWLYELAMVHVTSVCTDYVAA